LRFQESYHGYGIQNFLDVDPHFGTRQDLRRLVRTAHRHGIYVILDIILNHSGDVFAYDPDRYWTQDPTSGTWYLDPRWDGGPYPVAGYRNAQGAPDLPFAPLDAGQEARRLAHWRSVAGRVPASRDFYPQRAGSTTGTTIRSSWRAIFTT
jgi:glycosidase